MRNGLPLPVRFPSDRHSAGGGRGLLAAASAKSRPPRGTRPSLEARPSGRAAGTAGGLGSGQRSAPDGMPARTGQGARRPLPWTMGHRQLAWRWEGAADALPSRTESASPQAGRAAPEVPGGGRGSEPGRRGGGAIKHAEAAPGC